MLSSLDLMTQQSIELLVVKGEEFEPVSCGTGCIVKYKKKFFLLTLAHVTDYEETSTCIVLNKKPENGKTPLYCVGELQYFDEYIVDKDKLSDIKALDDLLTDFNETIDISFSELKDFFEIIQPEVDFGIHKVAKSYKMYVDLDKDVSNPSKENFYGFCGNIRHDKTQDRLKRTLTLKYDLKFHKTKGRYHMFLAPKIIKDSNDYKGCSGAPILDNHGKFVGLAAAVRENTQIVLGITAEEVKRLLDYQIQMEESIKSKKK